MNYALDCEREDDGRWLAGRLQPSGVLACGATREEAMAKAEALASRVVADQLDYGEIPALDISIALPAEA